VKTAIGSGWTRGEAPVPSHRHPARTKGPERGSAPSPPPHTPAMILPGSVDRRHAAAGILAGPKSRRGELVPSLSRQLSWRAFDVGGQHRQCNQRGEAEHVRAIVFLAHHPRMAFTLSTAHTSWELRRPPP
jgi:hypothetical protein